MTCSFEHEHRVGILNTIAVLAGFERGLEAFPGGSRPDVLRADPGTGSLFIGDAKHSGHPGDRSLQARLVRYSGWGKTAVDRGGGVVLAVCFGDPTQAGLWEQTLSLASRDADLPFHRRGWGTVAPACFLVWGQAGAQPCPRYDTYLGGTYQ